MSIININKRKEWVEKWEHKKTSHKTYRDGTLEYGKLERVKKHGKTIGSKFKTIESYPFRNVRIREVDKDIALARDGVVDYKVAIPINENIRSDGFIKLKDRVYTVLNTDHDYYKGESFILLQVNAEKLLGGYNE